MGANKCNDYWKLRSRHGRPAKYNDGETLWKDACKYFDSVKDNPFSVVVYRHGKQFVLDKERTLSIEGFLLFVELPKTSFYNMAADERFSSVIEKIRKIIWCDQFEMACAGLCKPCMVWRSLSLHDKQVIQMRIGIDAEG